MDGAMAIRLVLRVNGEYLDSNGKRADREVSGGYWQPLTGEQAQAVVV